MAKSYELGKKRENIVRKKKAVEEFSAIKLSRN
jgi:hypothetical protein